MMEQAAQQAVDLELETNNSSNLNVRRVFDPTSHDLESSFRLTKFADLRG